MLTLEQLKANKAEYKAWQAEYKAWRDMCQMLYVLKAVTPDDLAAPMSAEGTRGQRLLKTIRAWGEASAVLRMAQPSPVLPAKPSKGQRDGTWLEGQ